MSHQPPGQDDNPLLVQDNLRRSNRSRASAALFYAQLEELTKNIKNKPPTPNPDYLSYRSNDTLSFVKFIILETPKHSTPFNNKSIHIRRVQKKKQYDDEIYDLDMFKMEKTKNIKKSKSGRVQAVKKATVVANRPQTPNVANPNSNVSLIKMLISCAEQALDHKPTKEDKPVTTNNQSNNKKFINLNYIKRTNQTNPNLLELDHSSFGKITFQNQNTLQQKKFSYNDCDFNKLFNIEGQKEINIKELRKQFSNNKLNIPIYGKSNL